MGSLWSLRSLHGSLAVGLGSNVWYSPGDRAPRLVPAVLSLSSTRRETRAETGIPNPGKGNLYYYTNLKLTRSLCESAQPLPLSHICASSVALTGLSGPQAQPRAGHSGWRGRASSYLFLEVSPSRLRSIASSASLLRRRASASAAGSAAGTSACACSSALASARAGALEHLAAAMAAAWASAAAASFAWMAKGD